MIAIPIGHDQSVYGRQWIVRLLLVAQVIVFLASYLFGADARERIRTNLNVLDEVHEEYPDARVVPQRLASLPPHTRQAFSDLVASDEEDLDAPGSAELDRATKRAVASIEAQPAFRFGYRPGKPTVVGFFTNSFMHADLWHLAGNMLFLWLTGAVIECFWEALPFTLLYLASAAAGTFAHHLSAPTSMIPLVGASGAIAGLMGAFVVGHPSTMIRVFYVFWPIRIGTMNVPAWLLIPAWFALQIGYAFFGSGDGVAYWAHVGGFVTGVAGALIMRWGGWVTYDAARVVNNS